MARKDTTIYFLDENGEQAKGKTHQSFKSECDINNILKQYERTGVVMSSQHKEPIYGDFTQIQDYQTACNMVIQANETFAELPSQIRQNFNNDPAKFVAFVEDPKNTEAMAKMGLLKPKETPSNKALDPKPTDSQDAPNSSSS